MLKAFAYIALLAGGVGATFKNPLYGAVTCLLAYLLNPQVIVGDYVDIRAQYVATAAFLVSVLIYRHRRPNSLAGDSWPMICLWAFVAIGALSATWAVVSAQQSLDAIFEVFKTVLMISVLIFVIQTEQDMKIIMMACIIGAWHAAFMHTFGIRWGYVHASFGREFGVLPDGQTPVMVVFLPLILFTAMMGTTRKERLLGWCALPFVLNSVVSTYMRAGFVSLGVEALFTLLLLPKRIVLRLSPVVLAVGVLFVFKLTPDDYWARMATIEAPHEEASANSRFVINDASWRILLDYPMGVGYRNYPDVSPRYLPHEMLTEGRRSAHNSYFSVACETGFIGFAVWIFAFGGALLQCHRIRKRIDFNSIRNIDIYAIAVEIGLLGWMAGGCFQADHEVDPAYWFVGFAVVLTRLDRARVEASPDFDMTEEAAPQPA